MGWVLATLFFLLLCGAGFLLVRASKRLLEFDELLGTIVGPMQEYSNALRKLTSSEGLLHDHPEVVSFHRANVELLRLIDENISAIKAGRPIVKKEENLPRPEAA